jgi:hypothetical protein
MEEHLVFDGVWSKGDATQPTVYKFFKVDIDKTQEYFFVASLDELKKMCRRGDNFTFHVKDGRRLRCIEGCLEGHVYTFKKDSRPKSV